MGQQHTLEQYSELLRNGAARRQPAWLQTLRERAMAAVTEQGLPTRRLERWHYSPVDHWLDERVARHGASPIAPDEDARSDEALPGLVFHFSHGYLVSQPEGLGRLEDIELLPLSHLDPEQDAALIARLSAPVEETLGELVAAAAPEPWVLRVRAGVRVREPISLCHLASQPGSNMPRLAVLLEAGARATLIEHYSGAQDCDYLTLARTDLLLDENSELTYVRCHRDGDRGEHLGMLEVQLGAHSHCRLQALAASGQRLRNGIDVHYAGEGAELTCRGSFVAAAGQHVDYRLAVNHEASHGISETRFQGLADDDGRGIVNGRLYIARDTRGNDGRLATHNLLLSDRAEIDAKPELEIHADEVSCAHGATIGQLDAEQILYLQTRGISRDEAVRLMTSGFLRSGVLECGSAVDAYMERQLDVALSRLSGLARARKAA